MSKHIIAILLLLRFSAQAQEKLPVFIRQDTVYNNDKAEFLCIRTTKDSASAYKLKSFDNSILALLMIKPQDSGLFCSAHFPAFQTHYEVIYPRMDIAVLMESYLRNKVIAGGKVDSVALNEYCKERNIELKKFVPKRKAVPADSALAASAKAYLESLFSAEISNRSAAPVRISIGRPSNNRRIVVGANQSVNEKVAEGDSICIVDHAGKNISCTPVSKSKKTYAVLANGAAIE